MAVCEMCQAEVEDQDVLTLEGMNICASCKPAALAKLQEQGSVADVGFDQYDFAEFKKLRDASESVRALGVLWCIAVVICLFAGFFLFEEAPGFGALMLAFSIVYLFGIVGAFTRKAWARPLGMTMGWVGVVMGALNLVLTAIAGSANLLGVAIQIAISVITIRSFGVKELFGPDRFDPKEIRAVWKERKRTKT